MGGENEVFIIIIIIIIIITIIIMVWSSPVLFLEILSHIYVSGAIPQQNSVRSCKIDSQTWYFLSVKDHCLVIWSPQSGNVCYV